MSDVRLKISPPWVVTIKKIEALFDGDPQIACNVNYGSENPSIVLACNNGDKVAALMKILPDEFEFGNVKLNVEVDGVPSNRAFKNKKELFETAFMGNPAFVKALSPVDEGYGWFSMVYCVWKHEICQIFCDNLNDPHGLISTLYQDIASEVLTGDGAKGVYFSTDLPPVQLEGVGNQWP